MAQRSRTPTEGTRRRRDVRGSISVPQCVPQRARRKGPFKNPPLSVCDISSQSQAYFVSVAPRGALCDQRFKPHSSIYRTCPPNAHLNRAFSRCLPAARPRLSAAANGSPAPYFPGVYHVARPAAHVCRQHACRAAEGPNLAKISNQLVQAYGAVDSSTNTEKTSNAHSGTKGCSHTPLGTRAGPRACVHVRQGQRRNRHLRLEARK